MSALAASMMGQPRARGGPGTDVRLALCWARPSGPCLLHEVGVVLARGGRGRSRTYFFRENCVIPQTTGGRPQWSAGKVRSRGESQFPMRER